MEEYGCVEHKRYPSVGVVIPARNEEHCIGFTIRSLLNQTLRPSVIVVVDDGSSDNTSGVARSLGARVVRLDRRSKAPATGTPYLAYVMNRGLKVLEKENVSFVMISGAECEYPRDYLYKLVQRMICDRVVLASGVAEGERTSDIGVRGAGRVILASWFRRVGFRYPLNYGFEAWLVLKALSQGLRVRVYPDIRFRLLRPTSMSGRKAFLYGKAMKALGYDPVYAMGRSLLVSLVRRSPELAALFLRGYLSNVRVYSDIVRFTRWFQAKRMLSISTLFGYAT